VIEKLFQERLPEFYETLAFHFKKGQSTLKAINYLTKSGEKSLKKYSIEEAHQYYKEAFDILKNKPEKSKEDDVVLVDLLFRWSLVFYYRGDFKELINLMISHEQMAESLNDKSRQGMFYAWLGFALFCGEGKSNDSYQYVYKALKIGEEIDDQKIIGYACAWLTWICADLGSFDEAVTFGERALKIHKLIATDHYLYFKSLGGMAFAQGFMGEGEKVAKAGSELLDFGRRYSNVRSMAMGHGLIGFKHFCDGDFPSFIEHVQITARIAADPFYYQIPTFFLGLAYLSNGQIPEAEKALNEVVSFSEEFGDEYIGAPARALLGVVSIAKGNMGQGLKLLEEGQRIFLANRRRCFFAQTELILGKVYMQIVKGEGELNLSTMIKNVGFILKNVPFASHKAEKHFNRAIEVAKEIGASGILGGAYLDLGLLHKIKKRNDRARECISKAIKVFEKCEAKEYLKAAKEALASLGQV
jgi:tetratricopeptide (TPR) repeat protein